MGFITRICCARYFQNLDKQIEIQPASFICARLHKHTTSKHPKQMKKMLFLLFFAFVASNVSAKMVTVFCFYADKPASVYENQVVRISIEAKNGATSLCILNKTDDILYVDKGNSFQSLNGATPVSLYTNASYTEGSNRGRGASVNVGSIAQVLGVGGGIGRALNGVSIGGNATDLNSATVYEQRVVALAPHAVYEIYTWGYLYWHILNKLGNGKTIRPRRAGRAWNFTQPISPIQLEALVSYAQKEDLSDIRKATVSNYVSAVRMAKKNASVASLGDPDLCEKGYIEEMEGLPTGIKILAIGGSILSIGMLCCL